MLRNPDFEGHQTALSLADRQTTLRVSDCKFCGHAIAWAKNKAGKWYPCEVREKQTMDSDGYSGRNGDVLRAAPWQVHTRVICERYKADDAERNQAIRRNEAVQNERAEAAAALPEFDSICALIDRARGYVLPKDAA